MNKLIFTMGVFAAVSLRGQTLSQSARDFDLAFQTFGNVALPGVRVLDEGFGNQVVRGKPFSATEERHSLQVLGDGTRIENGQTNRLFRDADGRTRVEEMNGTISIYDPTNGIRVQLDPASKTAHRGGSGGNFAYSGTISAGGNLLTYPGAAARPLTTTPWTNNASTMQGVMSETTENLGAQNVNGVTAQGVRTSMIIPKGQIGNNKDIKVMTERWSSTDLQMLVKSVNSDPRFGDTTYQLTKITQSAPDAALFQVPADYTMVDQPVGAGAGIGRGGGRAGVPAAARAKAATTPAIAPPAPTK